MSREVGNLVYFPADKGKGEYYLGKLDLPGATGKICLVPNANRRSDNSPSLVLKLHGAGGWVEYGAAWIKAMQTGEDFLSITVDAPNMDKPIYVAAFMLDDDEANGEKDHWRIVWGRPRGAKTQLVPAGNGMPDDEIPF
ncbi:DUF736 domain-containing protein [Pelagibius sp.]|uniref:DUF736 domain-containing protein n=1 Tax=Pelagibius sp. TaxID=1931238 RepID=UPI002617E2D3|nr:DUF736 domain-containing protein [Pelagibius sp.]